MTAFGSRLAPHRPQGERPVSTEQYGVAAKHAQEPTGELVGSGSVSEDERARYVRGMFDAISTRYDLMNTLLSGGLHRRWKQVTVSTLAPSTGTVPRRLRLLVVLRRVVAYQPVPHRSFAKR